MGQSPLPKSTSGKSTAQAGGATTRVRDRPQRGSAGGSFAAMLLLEMLNSSFSFFDFACWLVIFLFSLSAHEAAHALVAQRLGDVTAYLGGQVTLDPIPHIKREPWGMLIVPIL